MPLRVDRRIVAVKNRPKNIHPCWTPPPNGPVASAIRYLQGLWPDQRGITGLETAIVLIAFVVVSSVFAFSVLSTGLFSSDKAKETISAGLEGKRSTLEMKGSIILTASTTGASGVVSQI